jgi:putative radical SAM enzyme (TIGR03279 family)
VTVLAYSGIISRVMPDSIADEIGLEQGDRLLAVDGQNIRDLIDLSFALADDFVELLIEKKNGEQEVFEIEKEYDEDLGLEFESAVFDGVRRCANKCIFCFVDQMAPGMRESLYVKDDDYRLSFLYGNFVTLTNLGPKDIKRISQLHLSPLYISVHTTNGVLRERMLNNKFAGKIMEQLNTLIANGVEMHTQIVLCPNINDGEELEKTISDLYALHPNVLSMAIVPVGLSRFRGNCYNLEVFTPEKALAVVEKVNRWQEKCRKESGTSFVYLSDEFYLAANQPIPAYEMYDGFPQLENGIGLVRNFLAEWQEESIVTQGYSEPHHLDVVCGVSAQKILGPLLRDIQIPNLNIRVLSVENFFFGTDITVSGLLTGQDIISTLNEAGGVRTGIIIPGASLKKGESIFLDDMTCDQLEDHLATPVRAAYGAKDLRQLLQAWR